MRPPPRQQNPANWRPADHARLACSQVNPMLKLEEPALTISIHVIRNRRPAQLDGMAQHLLNRRVQSKQFRTPEPSRHAPRPDSRPKETLVGIDIAHPMQQRL